MMGKIGDAVCQGWQKIENQGSVSLNPDPVTQILLYAWAS